MLNQKDAKRHAVSNEPTQQQLDFAIRKGSSDEAVVCCVLQRRLARSAPPAPNGSFKLVHARLEDHPRGSTFCYYYS